MAFCFSAHSPLDSTPATALRPNPAEWNNPRMLLRILLLLAFVPLSASAAELSADAARAFDAYIVQAEQQMATGPFLYTDAHPEAQAAARQGKTVVTEQQAGKLEVPGGLIHDWLGSAFIPGATIADLRALLQDYSHYKAIYAPDVIDSKLLSRQGDRFHVYLRMESKQLITLDYDSEYDVQFSSTASDRLEVVSRSTAIRQTGDDQDFLWRLNSYWRLESRDGGVYLQCRAISLSRSIPPGFGWLHGFLEKFPRDSMVRTIEATRRGELQALSRH